MHAGGAVPMQDSGRGAAYIVVASSDEENVGWTVPSYSIRKDSLKVN